MPVNSDGTNARLTMVDSLNPRAAAIMDLYISGLGPAQIADRIGCSIQYTSTIIHAPNFQHQLAIRRERMEREVEQKAVSHEQEAVRALREHAKDAAEKMIKLMSSDREAIQLRAAADILDRVGPSKQNQATQQTVVVISDKDAALIKESLTMDGENLDRENV